MISLFQAANALMGVLWVVFIPSYYSLVRCQEKAKKNDEWCETTFWMAAGELVQQLWYPGIVKIQGYGARGIDRTRPNSDGQVLQPACVPCPAALVAITNSYPKDGPQWKAPEGSYQKMASSRLTCVRVQDLLLNPKIGTFLVGKGGEKMTAKEYVWYQLFGGNWKTVEDKLKGLAPSNRALEASFVKDALFRDGSTQTYNKQLFAKGSPWPWMRAKWGTAKAKTPMGQELEYPNLLDWDAAENDGYYLLNGVPFIAPRLWDYYRRVESKYAMGDTYDPNTTTDWVLKPVVSTQFKHQNKNNAATYGLPQAMQNQCETTELGWYTRDVDEREWWYPGTASSTELNNAKIYHTSLLHWTDEMYLDYITRFFTGGEHTIALWQSAM